MSDLPFQLSPEDYTEMQKNLAPLHSGMTKAVFYAMVDMQHQKLMESCKRDPQLSAKIDRLTDEFHRLYDVDKNSIGNSVQSPDDTHISDGASF